MPGQVDDFLLKLVAVDVQQQLLQFILPKVGQRCFPNTFRKRS